MVETKKALSINIPISVGGPAVVTLMSNQKAQTMVKNILRVGYNEGFLFVTIETNNSVYKDIPIPVFAQSNFMNGQIIEAGSNVPVNNGGYITVLKILNITERGIGVLDINNQSYTGYVIPNI